MGGQIFIYELYTQIAFEIISSLYNLIINNIINSQKAAINVNAYIFKIL